MSLSVDAVRWMNTLIADAEKLAEKTVGCQCPICSFITERATVTKENVEGARRAFVESCRKMNEEQLRYAADLATILAQSDIEALDALGKCREHAHEAYLKVMDNVVDRVNERLVELTGGKTSFTALPREMMANMPHFIVYSDGNGPGSPNSN